MSRSLSVGMQAALQASVIRPIFLLELEFVSTTVYLAASNRDWQYNGHTWLANNKILSIDDSLKETTEMRAAGGQVTLGGADSDMLALILGSSQQSKKGTFYLMLIDSADALVDVLQFYRGNFDHAEIKDDGTKSTIVVNYEHVFITLARSKELRYTKFCQDHLFSGDLGFDYAAAAEDWSGFWGKAARPTFQRKRKSGKH